MSEKIKCPKCKGAGFYLEHPGHGYYRDGSFGHNIWANCEECDHTGFAKEPFDEPSRLRSKGADDD